MLLALFSDIHGNREALDACVEAAHANGADKFIFLGDLVGYGADPGYIVDTVRQFKDDGAIVLKGNHDDAISGGTYGMNDYARIALDWTTQRLAPEQRAFLAELPLTASDGDVLFTHADASDPAHWLYITDAGSADRSLNGTDKRIVFCGHVHRPQLYHKAHDRPPVRFIPTSNIGIPLARSQRWQAVIGAVGQPRDEIPSAAYALYDTTKAVLTFMRASYDIERAAQKIHAAGLPQILAARLFVGR
jgi:diadenosine tetraphosphatase ApaH/serine/threonine PP2A family protein phosphatase